jgi:hypothetical protein
MSGQYEQIQALVLKSLDSSSNGTIPDSRELNLSTPDAQTTLKAVLDSLLSKEVSLPLLCALPREPCQELKEED